MSHTIRIYYTHIQECAHEYTHSSLTSSNHTETGRGKQAVANWQKILHRNLLNYCLFDQYRIVNAHLKLYYNVYGKPFLKDYPSIHFSGSHSHNIVTIALAKQCLMGWDVEFIRKLYDEEEIIRNYFSFDEYESYKSHSQKKVNAFYEFWTAKEASAKAFGFGLSCWNKLPDVICEGNKFILKKQSSLMDNWSVVSLELGKKYIACLVINQENIKIEFNFISHHDLCHFPNVPIQNPR